MRPALMFRLAGPFVALIFSSRAAAAQRAGDPASSVPLVSIAASRLGVRADSVPTNHPPVADTFLGSDKVKHFLMSAFLETLGFSALQLAGASRSASIAGATSLAAAAGIGREVHDGRTKRLFSLGDLTWDAMGIASGLLLISHTQR